jgi:hypothetical protein
MLDRMVYALTGNLKMSRPQKPFRLVLIALVVLIAGCRTLPKLKVEDEGVIYEHLAAAPFIIVGTVISSKQVGRDVIWHPERSLLDATASSSKSTGYSLSLFRVKVAVENVLRGGIKQHELDIYYYSHAGSLGGTPGIGMYGVSGLWGQGDRELFYLKKVDDVFRTYCDIFAPCVTTIFSGAHPNFKLDPDKSANDSLVNLLLTRGEGSTDQEMIKAVLSKSPSFLSPEHAILKWQEIAEHDASPTVRRAACEQLKAKQLSCPDYEAVPTRQ